MSETAGRVVDAEKARAARTAASSGPWRADDEHGLMPGTKPAWVVSRTDESGEAYLGDLAYIPQDMAIPEGEPTPQEQADAELMALAPDLAFTVERQAEQIADLRRMAERWMENGAGHPRVSTRGQLQACGRILLDRIDRVTE